jgi:hypothetical protein
MAEEYPVANPQPTTDHPVSQAIASPNTQSSIPINSTNGNKKKLIKKIITILILLLIVAGLVFLGTRFYKSWQLKQRDSKRKADIATLQKALETYKSKTKDQKAYPAAITDYTMVKSGVIAKLPQDPLNKDQYTYHYQSLPAICVADTCTNYVLFACLENKNDAQGKEPIAPCTIKSYKVAGP